MWRLRVLLAWWLSTAAVARRVTDKERGCTPCKPGWRRGGSSVASRLHATAIIRPKQPGCSRCSLGESCLVSVEPPFARMLVAMSVPCLNGNRSKRRTVYERAACCNAFARWRRVRRSKMPRTLCRRKTTPWHLRYWLARQASTVLIVRLCVRVGCFKGVVRSDQARRRKGRFACCTSLPAESTALGRLLDSPGELPLAHPSQRLHPDPCWGKQSCRILPILAISLHKLITLSDYSLPGGSSPIASALARHAAALALVPSHTMPAGV
ncbi:hypothetical protein EK21DRAFT_89934 [Setomelanomma holmii]|uniref:Secreted protein n=1 Tax=Setomelanomma holmii TaxID=210430 RepID=A0A9P4H6S7_9PLEO|nr:hypothetical protein EK21DRAFT_89934 [Setomelanomma holmii]